MRTEERLRAIEERFARLEKRVKRLEKELAKQVEQVHNVDMATDEQMTEWRKRGGASRAAKLTPERRREIAAAAGRASAESRKKSQMSEKMPEKEF